MDRRWSVLGFDGVKREGDTFGACSEESWGRRAECLAQIGRAQEGFAGWKETRMDKWVVRWMGGGVERRWKGGRKAGWIIG